jgi:hypothetical protein
MGAGLPDSCSGLFVRGTGMSTYELTATVWGQPDVHRWNGSSFITLGSFPAGWSARAAALSYYNGRNTVGTAGVRALDGSGIWSPVCGSGIGGPVHAVLPTAADIVIGGAFATISGVATNGIARGTSGAWQPLGPGFAGGEVRALTRLANGHLIAGGTFTAAGAVAAPHVARWDGTQWNPLGSGTTGPVHVLLTMPGGDVIAAGDFSHAGGQLVNRIARWNGTAWSSLGSGLNGVVRALCVRPNGDIVAGGEFTQAGGVSSPYLARWNGTTWSSVAGGPNAVVGALAVLTNGDVLVGGAFSMVGAQTAAHLARWNGSTWTGVAGYTYAASRIVDSIAALPNGGAIVSGPRASVGPFPARYDGQSLVDIPDLDKIHAAAWSPVFGVVLGGDFTGSGNVVSGCFARLVTNCPAQADPYGAGCNTSAGPLVLSSSNLPWVGSNCVMAATGFAPGAIAVEVIGFGSASTPLSLLHPGGAAGCNLLVASAASQLLLPLAGGISTQLALPNNPAFGGMVLFDQVLQIEAGGPSGLTLTSSNGVRLTVGAL